MSGVRTLGVALFAAALATSASAQYFGQNQVQYRDFDFKVLKTEHFDIYYYPEERQNVEQVARMAERWYGRFSKLFSHQLSSRQPVIYYASGSDFRQTNVVQGLGEGTGGVTEGMMRRVVLPSAGPLAETDHVLGHELVHAFQYDLGSKGGSSMRSMQAVERLPLWFVEGLAEYLSLGPVDSQTAMWLRDAVASNKVPGLKDLNNPRYFPYRFGHAFWAYVGGRWGDDKAIALFREGTRTGDPLAAIKRLFSLDEKEFSQEWKEAMHKAYAGFVEAENPPSTYGPLLIGEKRGGGDLNVGPALSPDGKRIVYLSERERVSIDLYLAEADTGKVIRKLASTATNPHFDSLQFIESAGAWSPDGKLFVQAATLRGHAALFLVDPDTGKEVKEVEFRDLSEVDDPSFAPDGHRLVFSALQGGYADLWTYDLQSGERKRLTNDAYAELHPVFSPEGDRIAYTTDRFGTDLDTLSFGNYRIAVLDLASGELRALAGYKGARNSDPQWAPDGKSLYFLSDADGATNVHRIDLATGELRQVTALRTGAAGITPLSPALTVASGTGRLAYSVKEEDKYRIYAIDDATKQQGQPSVNAALDEALVVLPPRKEGEGQVEQLLADKQDNLPPVPTQPGQPYKSKMSLQYVGQPSIGVGVDRFGGYLGGSTTLYFSDMLGNHNLAVAANVYGSFQDTAAQVVYTDLSKKMDWGVGAQFIPYLYGGGIQESLTTAQGQPVIADQTLLFRQTEAAAFAIGALPFNRADRIEVQATASRIGFSEQVLSDYYSPYDGSFLGSDKQNIDVGLAPLYLASVSGAFVHDTSIFGATSPIMGTRARLEVSPTFGSIDYTGVVADWRGYFMPVRPITFAVRATHVGRYGSGSEDQRFGEIYIGYPELLRGYDNISASECRPSATSQCPLYDRLFGSRMLLASAELRAPLVGLFTGRLTYGPIPVELALFADSGVAWTSFDKASFLGGDRALLTSVGAAARVNVLGFLVAEFSVARPLNRPDFHGWVWQWSFAPGF
jgi:WD40 repeat protein